MTTIKDLKKWLDNFPEDTIVEFAFQQTARAYQSYGCVEFESPTLENRNVGNGWEYIDFTGNPFVKETDPNYNKKYLQLGEKD